MIFSVLKNEVGWISCTLSSDVTRMDILNSLFRYLQVCMSFIGKCDTSDSFTALSVISLPLISTGIKIKVKNIFREINGLNVSWMFWAMNGCELWLCMNWIDATKSVQIVTCVSSWVIDLNAWVSHSIYYVEKLGNIDSILLQIEIVPFDAQIPSWKVEVDIAWIIINLFSHHNCAIV